MKFLIDAQLPRRLCPVLEGLGHEAVHTLDLPAANRTPDGEINRLSTAEQRIVITKDTDFLDSFLLHQQPYKLLLVTTGNIRNTDLVELFKTQMTQVADLLTQNACVELARDSLVVHM